MKNWNDYINEEVKKEPGILLLAYPYTFLWKPVREETVKRIWQDSSASKGMTVYIHIPFCKRKCLFCNFVSYFNAPDGLIAKYIAGLKKEMEIMSPFTSHLDIESLCIGGGTPNFLRNEKLEEIFKAVHKFMKLKKDTEMSIELFPDDSVNTAKLKLLRDYGINRISLGIQFFDERIKKLCNRFDTIQQNIKIYNLARKIGFTNINFDLIFGMPRQTIESWTKTLAMTVKLGPEHLSIYPISARNSQIPFFEYAKDIDVKKLIKMFNFTREFLACRGYSQISRHWYVKKRFFYKYNECFANLIPALGLGLNSISYNSNFTYKNTSDLIKYCSVLNYGNLPIEKGYTLQGKDKIRNYCFKKITYLKIDRDDFKRNFKKDIRCYFGYILSILEKFNLIKINKRYIKLTRKGIFYTALVKRCFYDFKVLLHKDAFYKNISGKCSA
jgi:oxygen-independent coproporphyrinogen-3 oxidase